MTSGMSGKGNNTIYYYCAYSSSYRGGRFDQRGKASLHSSRSGFAAPAGGVHLYRCFSTVLGGGKYPGLRLGCRAPLISIASGVCCKFHIRLFRFPCLDCPIIFLGLQHASSISMSITTSGLYDAVCS